MTYKQKEVYQITLVITINFPKLENNKLTYPKIK